jgi:hypothetical protein
MPKYKAIVRLDCGERHIVYQEANSVEEANRILSATHHQDVEATAVSEATEQLPNGAGQLPQRIEIESLASFNNAQNNYGNCPITTRSEMVQLVVAATVMFFLLLIATIVIGITAG